MFTLRSNMENMNTPRTDEEIWTTDYHHELCDVVDKGVARQLEMELTEKTKEVARLPEELQEYKDTLITFTLALLENKDLQIARFRQALELIACPERPDGTYNRDRRACELLAKDALKSEIK